LEGKICVADRRCDAYGAFAPDAGERLFCIPLIPNGDISVGSGAGMNEGLLQVSIRLDALMCYQVDEL
jgi:hypothetical protein